MNDDLEVRIRDAIRSGSEITWQAMVADEAAAMEVLATLERIDARIKTDLDTRRYAISAAFAAMQNGELDKFTYRSNLKAYVEWKRKATYFRSLVRPRMLDLQSRRRQMKDQLKERRIEKSAASKNVESSRYYKALRTILGQHTAIGPDCQRCSDGNGEPMVHPCATYLEAWGALNPGVAR